MATAEVTGVVALMRAANAHLSAAVLNALLAQSSRRVVTPSGTLISIDACDALARALGQTGCDAQIGALAEATPGSVNP